MNNTATTVNNTATAADIIIIGAGLTGLTLAKNLQEQGKSFLILEARDRIGGRIHTVECDDGVKVELGATWFFPNFKNLFSLIKELGVSLKEQYMKGYTLYDSGEGSAPRKIYTGEESDMFRISGGTSNIVTSLYENIDQERVKLSQQVEKIINTVSGVEVVTRGGGVYHAERVVTTLPPQLLVNSVRLEPGLPASVVQVMRGTQTWMGDSVKAVVSYKEAWWKEERLSGGVYSDDGPVVQMYDQSDEAGAALVGFLADDTADWSGEERRQRVVDQLVRLFGDQARDYQEYRDTVWKHEQFTMPQHQPRLRRHANVGHSVYQSVYWGGRLHIGGTETSSSAGGFMEGAVYSANIIANKLAKY